MELVGTRWYKCDFHIHSRLSKCFKDQKVTNEQWIKMVKCKGLDCVAITDHNDYRAIDDIKQLGNENHVIVFPGVEITCDSVKIHMLILFDPKKTGSDVCNFLTSCGIEGENLGGSAGTEKSVIDVCTEAKRRGAIVIAAHIDEFASISSMSPDKVNNILNHKFIDAVQVVNKNIWSNWKDNRDNETIYKMINEKYSKTIPTDQVDMWRKTYFKACEKEIPQVTFSDNPDSENDSKHGLWGIGKQFSWLKMNQNPDLESLRQAFLSNDLRLKLCDSVNPTKYPDIWIKSISINKSTINPYKEIKVDFNPQLNCIIGGRGSGKSSIVRTLAGAFSFSKECILKDILEEEEKFFKKSKNGTGIFEHETTVDIELIKDNDLYKISIKDVTDINQKNEEVYIFNDETKEWDKIDDINFINLIKTQIYTQKQIYNVAKEPDALMKIIDNDINEFKDLSMMKESIMNQYVSKCADIRSKKTKVDKESNLKTELNDIVNRIEKYKTSGISAILELKQKLSLQENEVKKYKQDGINISQLIENCMTNIKPITIDQELLIDSDDLDSIVKRYSSALQIEFDNIKKIKEKIDDINRKFKEDVDTSNWKNRQKDNERNYLEACKTLESEGIQVDKLDTLLDDQRKKREEIDSIQVIKKEIVTLEEEKNTIKDKYVEICNSIYNARKSFIEKILEGQETVKIDIVKCGNKESFDEMIKTYTQKDNITIEADIEKFHNIIDKENGIEEFRNTINGIRNGEKNSNYSAVLDRAIKGMDEAVYDKMSIFLPEDDLIVSYKPEGQTRYIPLKTASAGQKTTAILTFILAYGNVPLILDQPEDDLDNRLVYDLVVNRLKDTKSNRQLIIVTHNANIPVNGDAEFITSMNSESKYVEVNCSGTIDEVSIRKEICDVMEGSKPAFEMRAKKYHLKIVE